MKLSQSRVGFLFGRILLLLMVSCLFQLPNFVNCICTYYLFLQVPFRLTCQPYVEDNLAVLVMILTSWYALFFCRGFKLTGPFVIMIYRMMAADLLRFVIIYIIFVMGFAQCKTIFLEIILVA